MWGHPSGTIGMVLSKRAYRRGIFVLKLSTGDFRLLLSLLSHEMGCMEKIALVVGGGKVVE